MTASEQIERLLKIGCTDAIGEITNNHHQPLSAERLHHYIELAIDTGLVARVSALAEIRGLPPTSSQIDRLTKRCLQLEWFVDALSAAKLGPISEETRTELIEALISHRFVDNQEEAVQLLKESEE